MGWSSVENKNYGLNEQNLHSKLKAWIVD